MQVIVNIPDEWREWLEDGSFGARQLNLYDIVGAVMNGTILPPDHGDLIDLNELILLCLEHEIGNSTITGEPLISVGKTDDGDDIWEYLYDHLTPIIKAGE